MRNHVMLPAQRRKVAWVMAFTEREGLRVMKFLGGFFGGLDGVFFAMFFGQHFFSASGHGARFCLFQRLTDFRFFLGDFLLTFFQELQ